MKNTGTKLAPIEGLMASVLYSTEKEQRYLLEGSVNAAGDALEWLRSRFGLFQEYPDVDDLCWKAATDAVAFIGISGIGAPHWEPVLSSSIHGLTSESGAADIVRAVVEGIAFFMKDIAEAMQSNEGEPSSLVLSGGLSSLTYLAQVQADILIKDLTVSSEQEASALGAACLAGLQQGAWTRAEIKGMIAPGELVQNRHNPGLEKRFRLWKSLHEMTRGLDRSRTQGEH
jgi:glycerol kinase